MKHKPSVPYDTIIRRRIARDPEFAAAVFKESIASLFDGEFTYGLSRLRDIVKVGMGFSALSKAVGIPVPNLYRALSTRGNPTIRTLNKIISAIATSLGVDLIPA